MKRDFELEQQRLIDEHQKQMAENPMFKSLQSAFDLAADLNPGRGGKKGNDKKKRKGAKKQEGESDRGLYSNKSYDQVSEEEDEEETRRRKQ